MMVTNIPVNFEDARGTIRDIYPTESPDSVTVITSTKGAVRGNHVHHKSRQSVYMVSGRMYVFSRVGLHEVERHLLQPGCIVVHEPGEAHAYLATEDAIFLTFADGIRKGENYESDTERMPSLIDAWNRQGHSR